MNIKKVVSSILVGAFMFTSIPVTQAQAAPFNTTPVKIENKDGIELNYNKKLGEVFYQYDKNTGSVFLQINPKNNVELKDVIVYNKKDNENDVEAIVPLNKNNYSFIKTKEQKVIVEVKFVREKMVYANEVKNGTIEIGSEYVEPGDVVLVVAHPNIGYRLKYIEAVNESGLRVSMERAGNSVYRLIMPNSKVNIKAAFVGVNDYDDVGEDAWYYEPIKFVSNKGLMTGMSNTIFSPNTPMTRAMVTATLYRLENNPESKYTNNFVDVEKDYWYTDSINWAAEKHIVNGVGNKQFNPNGLVTREQLATILYNYTQYKRYDLAISNSLNDFSDGSKVSDWAKNAMSWAYSQKIINGMGDGTINPQGSTTRAQFATVLSNFCKNYNL